MPITLLDIFLLAVMLISGVLAMIRGFMREVLSIAAWAGAAIVTLYGYSKVLPAAKQYLNNDIVATAVTVAGLFLGTLIIISILTVRIADMILDSRIGALDRTLGFLFGLGARIADRRGGVCVFRLAGAGQAAVVGHRCKIAGRAERNRSMAAEPVAGRPRQIYLRCPQETAEGRRGFSGRRHRRTGGPTPAPASRQVPRGRTCKVTIGPTAPTCVN